MRVAEQMKDELRQQIAAMKSVVERTERPAWKTVSIQAFWGQPFNEEIDKTPIPANFRKWLWNRSTAPRTFMHIYRLFKPKCTLVGGMTPLAINFFLVKRLEVADLFDIRKTKGKSLKSYLAKFNNVMIRVNNPDQKFFVKAFQKGLRVGQFNNALVLRRPTNMGEIRAQAEKHIEAKEDLAY
ncbi:hypothetical protein CR513_55236, partial [Mucuna pruriens]